MSPLCNSASDRLFGQHNVYTSIPLAKSTKLVLEPRGYPASRSLSNHQQILVPCMATFHEKQKKQKLLGSSRVAGHGAG